MSENQFGNLIQSDDYGIWAIANTPGAKLFHIPAGPTKEVGMETYKRNKKLHPDYMMGLYKSSPTDPIGFFIYGDEVMRGEVI